jgi:chemotaxis protein CheX
MIEQLEASDVLLASASEIFETMIFMDLDQADDQTQRVEGDSLLGSITFTGELEGCVSICCNRPCAKAIATNMLAMDPDDDISEEEICDAIGEVTNMIMGSVKARLTDVVGNLDVSIPSVVSGKMLENSHGEKSVQTCVSVNIAEEYLAELCMLVRESSE